MRPIVKNLGEVKISGILFLVLLLILSQGKVSAQPAATIAGNAVVCQNAVSPVITFEGSGGVAPYVFTYTINGVTQSPESTSTESNITTVSVSATAPGVFTYILVSVTDASSNKFTITSNTATVTVNPPPTATISGTLTACGTTTLTAGTNASSPLYTWYKDDVVIDGQTGSTLVVTASGNFKVKIINGSTGCEQTSAGSPVTINPLPATSAIWHQ